MRTLLCISGKRFSGKDTFAAALQKAAAASGLGCQSWAFAGESKRLFVAEQARLGVSVDLDRMIFDREYKETWRPQLTAFTVAALARDPQVFVRAVAARIEADPRPGIVTDLRLRLEIEFLQPRFELVIVRLARSDAARAASGWVADPAKDLHHTETELDDPALWTTTVDNDGELAVLEARAATIFKATFGEAGAPRTGR